MANELTPQERAATPAVSRLGQEHPTPPDREVLKAIRDARRQGVTCRLRVTPEALKQQLRADYEHDETEARYFFPEPRR